MSSCGSYCSTTWLWYWFNYWWGDSIFLLLMLAVLLCFKVLTLLYSKSFCMILFLIILILAEISLLDLSIISISFSNSWTDAWWDLSRSLLSSRISWISLMRVSIWFLSTGCKSGGSGDYSFYIFPFTSKINMLFWMSWFIIS